MTLWDMANLGAGTFERIIGTARFAVSSLRVKSALNPMLWLCGIISVPCIVLAVAFRESVVISGALMVLAAMPVLTAIGGFIYFMLCAPARLQSEEYQIKHEALELIKNKGSTVELRPSSLEGIWNPSVTALPPRETT